MVAICLGKFIKFRSVKGLGLLALVGEDEMEFAEESNVRRFTIDVYT